MVSLPFQSFREEYSWFCEGELDLRSSGIQRILIDGLNLLFLLIFSLLLLGGFVRKHHISGETRRDWAFLAVSICCTVTGVAYVSAGLWGVLSGNDGSRCLNWAVCFVRALVWIALTVSLIVPRTKWTRILVLVWWISFPLLASALNVQVLVKAQNIQILDLVSWPPTVLLLLCAFKLFREVVSPNIQYQSLSEPLLVEDNDKHRTELGQASFISRVTFSWVQPLLCLGYSKPLVIDDVPALVIEDESLLAYQSFSQAWNSLRRENSTNSHNLVIRTLIKVYFKEMILVGIYALLRTISVVVAPLLLFAFIRYSTHEAENLSKGICLVGCLVLVKLIESLSQRHYFFDARRYGMRMRSGLMVAVYQKQLKLSSLARKRHSTGEIVNYIAIDAYRMGEFPWWFHATWSNSLQLFLSIGILFGIVGIGALPGLVPIFICGVINIPFAKILQNLQHLFMVAQDERLRSTSEILNNMKIIKLQSWEEKFKSLIESLRDIEFRWLSKTQMNKSYSTVLYWMSPTFISSVVFLGCAVWRSAPLNPSTIFTVLATLRSMSEPVRMIPEALSVMIQVKVSLDRLNAFLLDNELKDEDVRRSQAQNSANSVKIQSGSFSWDPDAAFPTLSGIELEVKKGQKIAVCGPVGAGKSSLLYSILGEIPKILGSVDVCGSIAYVSQTSWIQSGTIRDNILYGKQMDKTRYEKAIKACALDKDIDSFDHGDLTEIGQRGLNLSGGQKQRIQLARAVYNDADIYLLDDPFSAVDAHTAATLFNDCVMVALEKKTVILVTHQVEFLPEADWIVVMEGGQIIQSGNYKELLIAGTAFEKLVNAHKIAMTALDPENNRQLGESEKMDSDQLNGSIASYTTKDSSKEEIAIKGLSRVQLTEDEERGIGDVGWKQLLDYLIVSKVFLLLGLCIFAQTAFVALQMVASYWLAIAPDIPQINNGILIGVYAGISTTSVVFVFGRTLLASLLGLKASEAFFSGFTNSIFKAPMLFFDSTPVGRILTRASSDMSVVDFDIPSSIVFVMAPATEILSIVGIMAFVTWPVLFVAIIALLSTQYIQRYYLASARELIRINGTAKAPVMNYAAETSLGVVTIRAFDMTKRFFYNYLNLIDTDASLFFHSNAALEWLIMRVEAVQNLTLITGALLLVFIPQGTIPPGFVGLSLSYALTLTGTQVFMTRWYCNLANYIISVERIKQFMHIPSEPPAIVDDKRTPPSWPPYGRIDFMDLKIRYRPNAPLVLKGITCTFKEGTRVGVVGRTGSGKSTMISALFRLVEPASGGILIDGLDICSIGLKDLRMKLSIIPQEPTLFRGSVRSNLDPLGLYTDDEIWEALEKCQLKTTISALPNLLDSFVSDEGENWSVGQHQLFCLGRVLLKRNRILVLDEATASIDSATDAILQRVIRQQFSGCTVITIAHRVPTVTDSDMVMVLSYGKLVEYDEPSKLMQTKSSFFSKLVAEYWSSCRRNSMQSLNNH